jgi:hypothetical protein
MTVPGEPLHNLFSDDLVPLYWMPKCTSGSAWQGHIPFAHWLVHVARPRTLVELGTQAGVSYSAFCDAVARSNTGTRCFAVDTWQGDKHAGSYGETVFDEFKPFHDRHYGAFSTLLRTEFDDAVGWFEDGEIDVLHIDGLHTYEAVRHDFETWLPKLSSRAVVLFHDTNERRDDFGVWRFWEEVKQRYPAFEFLHSHGLGVLGVGGGAPDQVRALCSIDSNKRIDAVRRRFETASRMIEDEMRARKELEKQVRAARAEIAERKARLAEQQRKIDAQARQVEVQSRRIARLSGEAQGLRDVNEAILNSTSWRVTGPLRRVATVAYKSLNLVRPAANRTTPNVNHHNPETGGKDNALEPVQEVKPTQISMPVRGVHSVPPPKVATHTEAIGLLSSKFNVPGMRVLEVGSRVVTGANYRSCFDRAEYVGFDYYEGPNVDIAGNAHKLSSYFPAGSHFDLIYSLAVFEHLYMPWIVTEEIAKLLKLGGMAYIETHFSFSAHERPWNFFQFSELGLRALFNRGLGFEVVDMGLSNPIVGFFSEDADEYLRGRPVTELYCHSSILCRKEREIERFDWRTLSEEDIAEGTRYPPPGKS